MQNYVRNIPPHNISFRNSTIRGYILCDILTSDGMFLQVHGRVQWDNERQMHCCHPALVFPSLDHNQGKQSNVYLKVVYDGNRVKIYITPSTTHYHYFSSNGIVTFSYTINYPDSKVHGANIGPTIGSCRPQMAPILAPLTLLSRYPWEWLITSRVCGAFIYWVKQLSWDPS